jgi:hypothetical protein
MLSVTLRSCMFRHAFVIYESSHLFTYVAKFSMSIDYEGTHNAISCSLQLLPLMSKHSSHSG